MRKLLLWDHLEVLTNDLLDVLAGCYPPSHFQTFRLSGYERVHARSECLHCELGNLRRYPGKGSEREPPVQHSQVVRSGREAPERDSGEVSVLEKDASP